MKPIHQHFIAAALLFLFAFQASAQSPIDVTFTPATNNVAVGTTVPIQLKVVNFKNIGSFQFPIIFNQNVLQLVSVTAPASALGTFNTTLTLDPNGLNNVFLNPGRVAVSWNSNANTQPNGVTLANNASLFTLNFKVLTDCSSTVAIGPPPTEPNIEITTATGAPVTMNYQNGAATITAGTCNTQPPVNTAIYGFHIIANTIFIPQGEIGCMPLTANDFEGIQSMLFAMNWDAPKLELVATRNYGLPGTIDFGVFNPTGRLSTSWGTPSGNPITRPDLSTLYEVCFRAEGAAGASTLVTPNGDGFPPGTFAEVIDPTGHNIWKDTTGIKDTIFIVNNPAPATAVTYTAGNNTVIAGQNTCVDLSLKNFSNATYGEFAITYDTLKLKFDHIDLGANPLGITKADTATNNYARFFAKDYVNGNGDTDTLRYLQFSYKKGAGSGTIADGTVPFSVCFKAIGAASPTPTPVKVTSFFDLGNALVAIGAAKKNVGSVPVAAVNGGVTITSASVLSATATVSQNVSCAGGSNGAITLNVNNCNGTATYLWTGPSITNNNNTLKDQTGLSAGTYNVTITCSTGGTTTASANVTQPNAIGLPLPTITGVSCSGSSNGSINIAPVGGTGMFTYLWTGPGGFTSTQQNISGLAPGAYKVTITDSNACTFASSNQNVAPATPISIPTASMTMVNVKCKGGSDGSITIQDATGGTGPYTYAWSGPGGYSANTKNISGLKAGGYTVVVTDSKGCSFTNPALQITEPTNPLAVASPTGTNVKCFGGNDGSIQINVTGGTSAFTYVWKNVATGTIVSTSEDPTGLAAGVYAVTVTDAGLCTATSSSIPVNAPTAALTVTETHVDAACSNSATGSINLNISGGWNNQTVSWNPALPSIPNPTNVLPNTYEATVTDAGGCVVTISVMVGSASPISLGDYTVTHVKCHGEANGGIVIEPSGGGNGGVYQVSWAPGGLAGPAISNLAGGSYTPTVTNQTTGCTAVFPAITVTEPASIQVTSDVTLQTGATNNGKIDLTAVTGGTPAYQFNWSGPGGFTSTQQNISNLAAGSYVLTVTDANLCAYTTTISVDADNPVTANATVKNSCENDGCIRITVAPGATATPFVFSWGGTPVVTSSHIDSICGLQPGVYNITVTDAAGHSSVISPQTINQQPQAKVGDARVEPFDEAHNGSIVLSPLPATAPLTYYWNTGSTSSALVSLDSGTYTVTVTHSISGCTAVYSYHLNRQYPPVTTVFATTNPNCANAPTGVINFTFSGANGNGTPNGGYTFAWSGPNGFTATTPNITGLTAGTYTVTVTDQSLSTFTFDTTLVTVSSLAVTNVSETSVYNGYQVSTATACDGKAKVFFSGSSGATSILWSNGITTAENTTLCAGAYSVTVTDAAGCSSVWSDELTSPDAVNGITTVVAPVSCHGKCDGIAQVNAVGGVAPYTARWALPGGQFQQDPLANSSVYSVVDDLCGGSYSVTVTDFSGASKVQVVEVPVPAPISATFNQNPPSRFNSCDGETIIQAVGAANPINYSWTGLSNHAGTDARAGGLCAGEIVTYVIVDNNGCSATAKDTIEYPNDGCLQGSPVITPGQKDGKNDQLFITCAETFDNTVEIFNRWGQLVFNVQNYDNGGTVWTGETKSGAPLPEGVYFYVMTYTDDQGTQQRIKGYVNLLR